MEGAAVPNGCSMNAPLSSLTRSSLQRLVLAAAQVRRDQRRQAPRVLDDVDAPIVNTNYATQADLNPVKDAILREDPKGPYVNLIAVRVEDKGKPWVKALVEAYHTPEVKAFVAQKFGGSVLAGW